MQPVDAAYKRFQQLAAEIGEYVNSLETEADTRLKVIDRVLVEVLGWPMHDIATEPLAEGGFADYACSVEGRYRLIVEAKKDGRGLGTQGRPAGTSYKLSGPVFKESSAQEGIAQAIKYCGAKNAELACVTNGREWVVFRGTRLGDGLDTRDGYAFVFPTLVDVEEKFALFHALLSYNGASRFEYRPYFNDAEGQPIRTSLFHRALREPGTARFEAGGELAADVDKIMSSFFQRLTGDQDPGLVDLCFVETAESNHANTQLANLAEDIVDRIRALDTGRGDALTTLIERVRGANRHEFVLIVGTKGAGKSTFISRFFSLVLPERLADQCVVIRVDMKNSPGQVKDVVAWLEVELLREAEANLFPEGPDFSDLEGMFYDDYTRLRKGAWSALYESDKTEFRVRFGDKVEEMRTHRPGEFSQGLLRHVVNNRKKLPVIVLDNADHFDIDFQQGVYQYARSIYERAVCLVILPITDRTSWQLSKHGALQSFDHEALFLPTPPTAEIIKKRIDFIENRVSQERQRPDDRYFMQRGISLRLEDLTAFTRSLQRVFLQTSETSDWIGSLANHDVRRTLNLVRSFVGSPHLRVDDLIKAHLAGSAIEVSNSRAARALIRGHYDVYPAGQHDFVQNVFALSEVPTTPLLGVRVLQLLADVPQREHHGAVIDVSEILAYCTGMNLDSRPVLLWLDSMLKTGLLLNYDPTVQDIGQATRGELSPAGRQHLHWAMGNLEYLGAMAEVTPLLAEGTYRTMQACSAAGRWRERTAAFLTYLLQEDAMYVSLPDHDAYASQRRINSNLEVLARQLNTSRGRPHASARPGAATVRRR